MEMVTISMAETRYEFSDFSMKKVILYETKTYAAL